MKIPFKKLPRRYSLGSLGLMIVLLLLEFNNCGKINSQAQVDNSSNGAASLAGGPNSPVDPSNPYVLTCISSSDGIKVSMSLLNAVNKTTGGNNKINSLDWDQKDDLIVSLDNRCVDQNHFADPIFSYLDQTKVHLDLPKSVYVIQKESVTNLDLFIKAVTDSECVLSANKNHKLKINVDGPDTYFASLTHLLPSSTKKVAINAPKTVLDNIMAYVNDPAYSANDKIVKVAVIDTGIDANNPDLAPVLARDINNNVIGLNSTDNPGLGFTTDSGFHGTHVSGLIGAQYNNSMGITGVYGRNLKIYPMRTSNDGENMTLAAIVTAIQQAVIYRVDVINMSLGTTGDYAELRNAINDAMASGTTVVVAAGNDGFTLGGANLTYPAMYSSSTNGLITVGSLDLTSQTISSFSNRSATYVDILCPGSNAGIGILSTLPLSINIPAGASTGPGYGSGINSTGQIIQGTSMATPITSGAIAAVISMAKSRGKILPVTKIKEWLRGGGSPKDAGFSTFDVGGSYLDLNQLTTFAASQIPTLASSDGTGGTAPTITSQPVGKQAVLGEKVDLAVSATGGSGLTYQWFFNNMALTGAMSPTLSLSNIQRSQGGQYKVMVMQGTNSVTSVTIEVKVALTYCGN